MKAFGLILLTYFAASVALAAERSVKCEIDSSGSPAFKGRCLFLSEPGGSFNLRHADGASPLVGDISDVSVSIIRKNVAEVRGLTGDGVNSRWGEARRSKKDGACWLGSDFKICAW